MKHQIAIAALVITSMGLASLPAAAQDTTPVAQRWDREIHRTIIRDGGRADARGAGGLLNLVCSEKGAEALEIGFVRLAHRLDLTAEQQTLFDALKAKALTTQTSFADSCAAARPATSADAKPDLLERLKSGLKIDEARLSAMNAVLPDLEAFYASLTDTQKADLMPQRGGRGGWGMHGPNGNNGPRDNHGPRGTMRLPAPGR